MAVVSVGTSHRVLVSYIYKLQLDTKGEQSCAMLNQIIQAQLKYVLILKKQLQHTCVYMSCILKLLVYPN